MKRLFGLLLGSIHAAIKHSSSKMIITDHVFLDSYDMMEREKEREIEKASIDDWMRIQKCTL